jgi:hypothetical protein
MRDFSVNVIQQLLSKNVPVLWALSGPDSGFEASSDISPVDLFQHLILQALRLDRDSQTESGMSLQCARFHRASTEHDWLQLLGSSLVGIREVYLVVDLSTLRGNVEPTDGFSWPAAFNSLFAEIAKRSQGVRVKVLLLAGMTNEGAQASAQGSSDILIPVRVTQTPVRRRKQIRGWLDGPQHRRGRQGILGRPEARRRRS